METLLQDIRYALRMLRKSPGFTAVAVLTLALGIGANTAIFSAVNGILLKPVPYVNPSQLYDISAEEEFPGGIAGSMVLSQSTWQKVRVQTAAIAQMALSTSDQYRMTGDAAPQLIFAAQVSNEFFSLLGCKPVLGRPILPGDTQAGAKPVAIISYALWKARWGGDKSVLNHTITLDAKTYSIIGVMPPGCSYPIPTRQGDKGVWLPLITSSSDDPECFPVVRLKNGVSLAAMNAELKTVSPRILTTSLDKRFGNSWSGSHFVARPLEKHFGDLNRALLILLGAVGFVLVIACVNVSGLLLARGWARHREVAIREALGASRLRIVRQFLTESVLLAVAGGALGLLFAVWGVHVLRVITPEGLPEHGHFELNANILWFTLAVSLVTGILFGLAPALQGSSRRVGAAIRDGFDSAAQSSWRRPRRLRSVLVVFEIALALILVIGATLVARSFQDLLSVKLGFRTDHIVTMDANFSNSVCDQDNPKTLPGCEAAISDVVHCMQNIPGVQSAAVASAIPLARWLAVPDVQIEGRTQHILLASGDVISSRIVSPDYFQAFGIPLLRGRDTTDADTTGSQRVAIVDSAFAKRYFGGHALGHRISISKDEKGGPEWAEIVGVVANAHDTSLTHPSTGEVYEAYAQWGDFQDAYFIVRTLEDPAAMTPALRRAIWSEDKDAPITDVMTMDQIVRSNIVEPKFQALLLGSFGVFGLILAVVGIYGVISYSVTQRTHEIGVRMALGAEPGQVMSLILAHGLKLTLIGVVIGMAASLALTHLMSSLLFGVSATDPVTFTGVAILLLVVSLVACYIPARRAMRVDPMVALRYE